MMRKSIPIVILSVAVVFGVGVFTGAATKQVPQTPSEMKGKLITHEEPIPLKKEHMEDYDEALRAWKADTEQYLCALYGQKIKRIEENEESIIFHFELDHQNPAKVQVESVEYAK